MSEDNLISLDQSFTAFEINRAHDYDDVDSKALAHHHTLGTKANQAAAGNHNHGPWLDYDPNITGPTIGNGVVTGRWIKLGSLIHFQITFTLGSTSAMAALTADVPVPAKIPTYFSERWVARDVSAAGSFFGDVDFLFASAAVTFNWRGVTAVAPFVWAVNDFIGVAGSYEPAL